MSGKPAYGTAKWPCFTFRALCMLHGTVASIHEGNERTAPLIGSRQRNVGDKNSLTKLMIALGFGCNAQMPRQSKGMTLWAHGVITKWPCQCLGPNSWCTHHYLPQCEGGECLEKLAINVAQGKTRTTSNIQNLLLSGVCALPLALCVCHSQLLVLHAKVLQVMD